MPIEQTELVSIDSSDNALNDAVHLDDVVNSQAIAPVYIQAEMWEIFKEEFDDELINIRHQLDQWQQTAEPLPMIDVIRRAFHTLKGSGRMVGATALGDYAWEHESLLNHVLSGQWTVSDKLYPFIEQAYQLLYSQADNVLNDNLLPEALLQQKQQAADWEQHDEQGADTWIESTHHADTDIRASIEDDIRPALKRLHHQTQMTSINMPALQSDLQAIESSLEPLDVSISHVFACLNNIVAEPVANDAFMPVFKDCLQFAEDWLAHKATDQQADLCLQQLNALLIEQHDQDTLDELDEDLKSLQGIEIKTSENDLGVGVESNGEGEDKTNHILQQLEQITQQVDESSLAASLFIEDLPELMAGLDKAFEQLQKTPEDEQAIKTIEHQLHTLKGGARMGDFESLADKAHQMESDIQSYLFDPETIALSDEQAISALQNRMDELQADAEAILQTATLASAESLEQTVELADEHDDAKFTPLFMLEKVKPDEQFDSLLEQVLYEQADELALPQKPAQAEAVSAEENTYQRETIRLPSYTIDKLVAVATDMNVNQSRLSGHLQNLGGDTEELTRTVTRLRQYLRELEMEIEERIRHSYAIEHTDVSDEAFDPLEMDEYAEVQQLSRQLSEGLNDLINIEQDISSERIRINQLQELQTRTGREMQQELLATRMTEITFIIPRLKRVVRQTADSLHKSVELSIQGEDCELDRVLIQNILPTLEHMLRNAISHGIESPEQRKRAGKPETGQLTINIQRGGAEIFIELSDDGCGIDQDNVRKVAVEQGLIEAGETLSLHELYRLILRPGFTTTQTLDQISGRGIGMDVAYTAIKNMGGSLQIETAKTAEDITAGTRFTIRLPLTLATNQILLVEAGGQRFALPMNTLAGLQRLTRKELEAANAGMLAYQGQDYCLTSLASLLGRNEMPVRHEGSKIPVAFFMADKQAIALQLDRLIGNREVVLKPLPGWAKVPPIYSTASIQADGEVILVLNMSELAHWRAPVSKEVVQSQQVSAVKRVLVVDDSITVRKVTERLLLANDYDVFTAKDGMHALEVMEQHRPDIILLDIEMPRMDGFEFMSTLKQMADYQHIPVIMISSRSGAKHSQKAKELGVSQFLGKPYQESVLLDTIHATLVGEKQ